MTLLEKILSRRNKNLKHTTKIKIQPFMNAKFKPNSLAKAICCFGTLAISFFQINVGHAQGTALAPGGDFIFSPISGEALGPVGGTTLDSFTEPFSSTSFAGSLTSSVISGDTSSTLGGLTFTYQFSITAGPDASGGISLGSFAGFDTDVSYQIPAAGVTPFVVNRSASGDNIEFYFIGSQVDVGETSALLVVQTDSQVFNFGTSTVNDNTGSPNVTILAPIAVVGTPEPTSVRFVLLGLAVLAFARYFRKVEQRKAEKI
jgi:hypothetical protein